MSDTPESNPSILIPHHTYALRYSVKCHSPFLGKEYVFLNVQVNHKPFVGVAERFSNFATGCIYHAEQAGNEKRSICPSLLLS